MNHLDLETATATICYLELMLNPCILAKEDTCILAREGQSMPTPCIPAS